MGEEVTVKGYEFQYVLSSFKGNVGIMGGGQSVSKGQLMELGHNIMALPSTQQQQKMSAALKKAVEAFKPEVESRYVRMREDERGLVITLSSDVFFETGSAHLKGEMRPVLGKLARVIRNINNFVRIEGHTDNSPLSVNKAKETYRSNWELSSARALNVLHYLADEGDVNPSMLSSVAFGEFRPIEENGTPQGRAYNRRVDIVILKERFIKKSEDRRIPRPLPDEEWR
jgi:chemotaxis protein MotB